MPRTADVPAGVASIRARTGGYIVDMVIFAAIAMIMVVIAGFVLLASTSWAEEDPSDPQYYTFLAIIGLGIPIVWTMLNLALLATRQQTGGQYVAGVRLRRGDGAKFTFRDATAWWFSLNPLLFSWPMAIIASLPLAAVFALVLSRLTLAAFGVLITLCIVAPLVALVSALLDGENRALHERVVGLISVPVDAP